MTKRDFSLRRTLPRCVNGLAAFAITVTVGPANAQSQSSQQAGIAFEVASIKPNTSGEPARGLRQPGGRFTAVSVPILQIIRQAYGLLEMQVANVPDWVKSERYDILAKAPDGVERLAPLLQSLLNERFQFAAHIETREMPIYDLVLARQDRKLGGRVEKAAADCTARPPVIPPTAQSDEPPCAQLGTIGRRVMRGYPMSSFAQMLASEVGRVVFDKTGLAGTWNLELEYSPDRMPNIPPGGLPPGVELPSPDAPSLFTALQEQLGLELKSERGPVQVLAIDSIDRPTPD